MTQKHVWERVDIELEAADPPENPYTDVTVWADLKGPGFDKRVYGFWDGGSTWIIRIVATCPGTWSWVTGSETAGATEPDAGLSGQKGSFEAIDWSEEERDANPNRRGFLRPGNNGHAFTYADGTPFLLLGDTWWATPTFRYPWKEGNTVADSPDMSFQGMVAYRKRQGFNTIAMIASHPVWANDGLPVTIYADDEEKTVIRNGWLQAGTESAKDMHNEGGRPFFFPGNVPGYETVVPDFDRINPDYFRYMDRKIDYLSEQGFVSFIEVARRDVSQVWKKYGGWPDSYARYIHYVFCRYHANNTLLSPIHFDWEQYSIPSRDYNEPANQVVDTYGPPPFGNLEGTNAAPSTLANFGPADEARWVTFHQTGNWREHDHYWYLTEMYHDDPARPAINGEPYYPGYPDDKPPTNSDEAEGNNRSGLYGSFLSGAIGGMLYGVEGMWGGDIEPEAKYKSYESITFKSGDQVRHLKTFVDAAGDRYEDLVPDSERITPNKSGPAIGYRGWAYGALLPDKSLLLAYFERGCLPPTMRGLLPEQEYRVAWFDPRNGTWGEEQPMTTDPVGRLKLDLPDDVEDWGLMMKI